MSSRQVGSAHLDISARTKGVVTGMEEARRATRQAAREMRAEVKEATGTISLMGEEIGIKLPRHLRTFVAQLPGVASAMSAAFSGAAVVGLGMIVVEQVKRIYEAFEKLAEMPEKISKGFEDLTRDVAAANDKLTTANDKLQNAIDKFRGLPENHLKVMLDEATDSAIGLGKALMNDIDAVNKLMKENTVPFWAKMLGEHGLDDAAEQFKEFQGKIQKIDDDAATKLRAARNAQDKKGFDATRDAYGAAVDAQYNDQIAKTEKLAATMQATRDKWLAKPGPMPAGGLPAQEQINAMTHAVELLREQQDQAAASIKNMTLEETQLGLTGLSAAERLRAAQKALFEDLMHQEKTQTEAAAAEQRITEDLTQTWLAAYHADVDAAKEAEEGQKKAAEASKRAKEERLSASAEEQQAIREGLNEQYQAFAQTEQMKVAMGQESNAEMLSDLEDYLARVHENQQKSFDDQLALYDGDEKGYKKLLAEKAKDQAEYATRTAEMQKQAMEGGIGGAFLEIERRAQDFAGELRDTVGQAIGDVNTQLMNLMSGKKANFAGMFSNLSQSFGKIALNAVEGPMMSHLGLGGANKPDGSAQNPFHVTSVNDAKKKGTDILGSVLGSPDPSTTGQFNGGPLGLAKLLFGGGLQEGGPTIPGHSYIVGERGMELFTPRTAGTVTSNSALSRMGSTTHHMPISIDARGSNDPAAVNAAVHRAMRTYVPVIVGASYSFSKDQSRRVPPTSNALH